MESRRQEPGAQGSAGALPRTRRARSPVPIHTLSHILTLSHTHKHTHTRTHALPSSLVASATISELSPAEREPKLELGSEASPAWRCRPRADARTAGSDGECGWVWMLQLGWGRRGAGGEVGCQPAGSAACAASDWAGTSGAAVGVGCGVLVRERRARSAPLGVTALPSCYAVPPNPHLAQKSPKLRATL